MSLSAIEIAGLILGFIVFGNVGLVIGYAMVVANSPVTLTDDGVWSNQVPLTSVWSSDPTAIKVVVILGLAALIFYLCQRAGLIPSYEPYESDK
jgi:hypothetical protein